MCARVFLTAWKPSDEVHRRAFELQNPCNPLGCFPAVKGRAGVSRRREAEPIDAGGIHLHPCSCRLRLSSCVSSCAPAPNKAQLSDHGENPASERNHLGRSPAQRSGSSPKASRGGHSEMCGKQMIDLNCVPLGVCRGVWGRGDSASEHCGGRKQHGPQTSLCWEDLGLGYLSFLSPSLH